MIFLINTRQLIANQQIKTAFATNGIMLTLIHQKTSINLLINSLNLFTSSVFILFGLFLYPLQTFHPFFSSIKPSTPLRHRNESKIRPKVPTNCALHPCYAFYNQSRRFAVELFHVLCLRYFSICCYITNYYIIINMINILWLYNWFFYHLFQFSF